MSNSRYDEEPLLPLYDDLHHDHQDVKFSPESNVDVTVDEPQAEASSSSGVAPAAPAPATCAHCGHHCQHAPEPTTWMQVRPYVAAVYTIVYLYGWWYFTIPSVKWVLFSFPESVRHIGILATIVLIVLVPLFVFALSGLWLFGLPVTLIAFRLLPESVALKWRNTGKASSEEDTETSACAAPVEGEDFGPAGDAAHSV